MHDAQKGGVGGGAGVSKVFLAYNPSTSTTTPLTIKPPARPKHQPSGVVRLTNYLIELTPLCQCHENHHCIVKVDLMAQHLDLIGIALMLKDTQVPFLTLFLR